MIILRRYGQQVNYQPEQFWSLCAAQRFLRTDEIYDWNGRRFLRADQFSDIQPYLPPMIVQETIENLLGGAVAVGVVLLAGAGIAAVVDAVFPNKPSPRRRRDPAQKARPKLRALRKLEERLSAATRSRDMRILRETRSPCRSQNQPRQWWQQPSQKSCVGLQLVQLFKRKNECSRLPEQSLDD